MTGPVSRVLMTCDAIGGVWSYSVDLGHALGDAGIEVVLAVMGRPLSEQQHRDVWGMATVSVVEGPYKLEWMNEPWADVERAGEWLLELERRYRPDLIHINGYAHAVLPFAAPTLVVGHSCVLSWWEAVKCERAPREWDAYRERVSAGLARASWVVTPTLSMLRALERHYGPMPRASVIPNGCDLERYQPDIKEPFIFSAGRLWDAAKNAVTLSRAAGAVCWPVYIAGDAQRPLGISEGSEERKARQLHTLGQLSRGELARWLGRASIYAFPARYEPFGLSVLEAAAAGCALVLGDIPSLRELWQGCALFVPPEDDRLLARALEQLITDGELRLDLGQRAYARAQRYSLPALRTNYLQLYDALLRQAEAPRASEPQTRGPVSDHQASAETRL
jgi:glycogen synthase